MGIDIFYFKSVYLIKYNAFTDLKPLQEFKKLFELILTECSLAKALSVFIVLPRLKRRGNTY